MTTVPLSCHRTIDTSVEYQPSRIQKHGLNTDFRRLSVPKRQSGSSLAGKPLIKNGIRFELDAKERRRPSQGLPTKPFLSTLSEARNVSR
jgi:hypothetical protein